MRYISLFSGVEAATLASEPLGWEPVAFCEVDDFPSAVLADRFPDVPNLGDVTKVDWSKYRDKADLVIGGSPCFVAGTMVLTEQGFKPIEDVQVGDLVLTHKKRLKRVSAVGSKESQVGVLDVRGVMNITCTPNHPILASRRDKVWNNSTRRYEFVFEEEEWVCAEDSTGMVACLPSGKFNVNIPDIPTPYDMTVQDVMELIGWYLGDGSIQTKGKRNPSSRALMLSINPQKLVEFDIAFGNRIHKHVHRVSKSQITACIYSTELCNFIECNFGRRCDGKNIPAWVFAMDDESKSRLFAGYMKTDGHDNGDGTYQVESASKAIVLGMQMLTGIGSAHKLGMREKKTIKGHEYIPKQTYSYSYVPKREDGRPSGFWHHNGYTKRLVRGFDSTNESCTVYNLEVEDDNSYTADGIAVHNCQSYSIAGLRKGLDEPRGQLMLEFLKACRDIDPEWIIWENVPGVLSSNRGADFKTFLEAVAILWPRGGVAWRILDSQWFGVAQRRRRVFAVINTRDWRRAVEVLLDEHCLRGNTPTREQAREAAAANARGRVGENLAGQ